MNFLLEKKFGVPSHNFVKKNVFCEKGDEITRFDGTTYYRQKKKIQYKGLVIMLYTRRSPNCSDHKKLFYNIYAEETTIILGYLEI